jgi:hypothetical protein
VVNGKKGKSTILPTLRIPPTTYSETATMTSEASIPESHNVFIYNEDTKNAIPQNVTHVKVDPSVKVIHKKAFSVRRSLVAVEFSEGLERIGSSAFRKCINLKYINKLPSTLREIGNDAFRGCTKLVSIEFPERLQEIGSFAFLSCQNLKRIKIRSARIVIKLKAFSSCYGLISVELPEGLKFIRHGCFEECASLTSVNVPSSVIVIEKSAFANCDSLASLDLPEGLQSIGVSSFRLCKSLESLRIPSTVCKIGKAAFYKCEGLRSITLPETLVIIEDHMFYKCTSLTHIEIPPTVTKIGRNTFELCVTLKHLRVPSSVVGIGYRAFGSCTQLGSVHLLGNLHTIEQATFHGCSSLTHVRIPTSVARIERDAFVHCTRLISLELPEGLETFHLQHSERGPYFPELPSIYGCESLVSLVLPSEREHTEQLLRDAGFMDDLKLRHVASSLDDLVSKLQHRFDDLSVHRLCYYQSYYPLTEAMENLRQAMDADPSAGTKVDAFGMTPFHILALSQTPNLSLFQELLKVYKVDIICTKDKFGSNPIDYLCLNHAPEATTVIQSLVPTIFAQRLQWLGLARWKSDMLAAMDEALAAAWSSRRREIGLLYFKLATYERLESMSLLELTLWKVKIDGRKAANDTNHNRGEENSLKRPRLDKSNIDGVDRQSCRFNSGADVAISNVLPFLDKVCIEDYDVGD